MYQLIQDVLCETHSNIKMLKVILFNKFYSAVSRKGKKNRIKIKCDPPININHSLEEKNFQMSHKVKQKNLKYKDG